MKHALSPGLALALCSAAMADGNGGASAEGAQAYVVVPADAATVSNPVTNVIGLAARAWPRRMPKWTTPVSSEEITITVTD